MVHPIGVPDPVYEAATEVAQRHDMTLKEAVRHMCRNGGYDV